MSVSTVFSSHPSSLSPQASRRFLAATATVCMSVFLAGCNTVFAPSVTPLPSLSSAQQHRDDLARTEAATAWRAREFAAKATACQPCADVATDIAEAAQARLDAMGGLWSPWPDDLPQSALVERPFPVAEAPTMPADFAAWLAHSARHDLARVASGSLSDPERPVLAASAAGRLVAAHSLASAYGVTLPTDAPLVSLPRPVLHSASTEALSAGQTPATTEQAANTSGTPTGSTSSADAHTPSGGNASGAQSASDASHTAVSEVGSADSAASADRHGFVNEERGRTLASAELYDGNVSQWATWNWDTAFTHPQENASLANVPLADFPEISQAISQWDCAAQLLPGVGVNEGAISTANTQANALLTRAAQALSAGATDTRTLRCIEDSPTFESIAQRVIRGDFELLMSTNPTISMWGASVMLEDSRTWFAHLNSNLTGLIEPTPAQSNN